MLILVHTAPVTLEAYRHPNLGVLSSPRRWYRDVEGWPWAADNDCFQGLDEHLYCMMLDRITELPPPLFVVAPDVVGDADATVRLFDEWHPALESRGLPPAFVAQDGLAGDDERVPWDAMACLFIGGSTEFKLGIDAAELVRSAHERGKWVHWGRVNSYIRIAYAGSIGSDSVDGSGLNRYRRRDLPRHLVAAGQPRQGRLLP
jgi:hypothetical protein